MTMQGRVCFMNFDFLKSITIIHPFYQFCEDAEEFALSKPDFCGASARKAIEYIVRLMYTAAIQTDANQLTVYDMLCTPDFVMYVDDRTLLNAIHFIRRQGNIAVHQGGLTEKEAVNIVEQLHFVAGEVCIFLGLIQDYPSFDFSLLKPVIASNIRSGEAFAEEEPPVAKEIIQDFAKRLQSVEHYSQLRHMPRSFVDVHVNTSKYDEMEEKEGKQARINTSSNVRAAFDMIFKWFQSCLADYDIIPDYRLLIISVKKETFSVRIAVKMGCTNLGHRNASGEWVLLPAMDYVLYCFDIDPQKPIYEQFHVFTKEAFLQMWRDLGLIRLNITTAAHKRLRAMYGDDLKFNQEEHADSMIVQVFKTSRKKTKLFEEAFEKFPALDAEALQIICKA